MKHRFLSLLLLCWASSAFATDFGGNAVFGETFEGSLNADDVLPVDEAFALTVVREDEGIQLLWQIQPGYYLYRHRLAVTGSERVGKPQIPGGLHKTDEYFGDVEVYYEALVVDVPVAGDEKETFLVEYQGCAEAGICYPPQKKQFSKEFSSKSHKATF